MKQWGFAEVRLVARYDCFRATPKERTARQFGVHGVTVFARKPA